MLWTWNENRGAVVQASIHDGDDPYNGIPDESLIERTTAALKDPRIWVLSFDSCCFEGTIFIFKFFWPGTLQAAHDEERPGNDSTTPYGVVFATFMAAMVLGAILFNFSTRNGKLATVDQASTWRATSPTLLLGAALFASALSFLIAGVAKAELHLFLSFLLLEFCNGVYVPSMAYHRGTIVNDSGRTLIYGLMNIPLFVFVIAAIYTTSSDGG